MLKILIVEDHALVREALAQVLRVQEGLQIEEAASGMEALEILKTRSDFDLVLLDLALPGMDGFACLKQFREQYPHIPVVILSAYSRPETVKRALAEGAMGFIPKSYSGDELARVLRLVISGSVFCPDEDKFPARENDAPAFPQKGSANLKELGLTARQGEVIALMTKGLSNREISRQLGVSEGTVKVHLSIIFKRLGVSSRTQVIASIDQRGIRF